MSGSSSFADLRGLIADPPKDTRPEVRWWLAEGLHTDETLRTEIDAAHRMGFGGMEFLAMDEGMSTTPGTAGARRSGSTTAPSSSRRPPAQRHGGQLHVGYELVERQPADDHPGAPRSRQGARRDGRGPASGPEPYGRADADRLRRSPAAKPFAGTSRHDPRAAARSRRRGPHRRRLRDAARAGPGLRGRPHESGRRRRPRLDSPRGRRLEAVRVLVCTAPARPPRRPPRSTTR